jgi:hypothetical protein
VKKSWVMKETLSASSSGRTALNFSSRPGRSCTTHVRPEWRAARWKQTWLAEPPSQSDSISIFKQPKRRRVAYIDHGHFTQFFPMESCQTRFHSHTRRIGSEGHGITKSFLSIAFLTFFLSSTASQSQKDFVLSSRKSI